MKYENVNCCFTWRSIVAKHCLLPTEFTSNRCENFLSEFNLRQNAIVILHWVRVCAMSVARKTERMRHHKIVAWNFEKDKLWNCARSSITCASRKTRKKINNTKHSCNRRVYIYRVLSACVWSTLETQLFDDDWEEPWVISAYAQRLTRSENSITFLFSERFIFYTRISSVSGRYVICAVGQTLYSRFSLCVFRKWVQR